MTLNLLKQRHTVINKPTPAQPCLSIAEDRELDIAVQRIIHVMKTSGRMIKEMKKYLNSLKHLDDADQRLTTNLSSCALVHIDEEFRKIVENYHSITTQVGETVDITVEHCQKTFIEPLEKLCKEFVYIQDALNKREELVSIWKNSYAKKKKYEEKREKTAHLHVKLEKERKNEETAAKELKIFHSKLLVELPKFLEKRLEYLKPTLQALIAIQTNYYGNSTKLFTQLMPVQNTSQSPTSAMISDEEYQQTIDNHISRIKNLTIVKSD